MTARHTPGPWTVDNGLPFGRDYSDVIVSDGRNPLCTIERTYTGGETQANAALIAAAPELAAALLRSLPFVEDHEDCEIYKPGAVRHAVSEIRAALAKADVL